MAEPPTSQAPLLKRVSRKTPMGMAAAARHPALDDRKTVANGIRAQDADLLQGQLAPAVYQPLTVAGIDLKLEPVAPVLGTVVHGLDLERDLDNPEVVKFLRDL